MGNRESGQGSTMCNYGAQRNADQEGLKKRRGEKGLRVTQFPGFPGLLLLQKPLSSVGDQAAGFHDRQPGFGKRLNCEALACGSIQDEVGTDLQFITAGRFDLVTRHYLQSQVYSVLQENARKAACHDCEVKAPQA